MSVLALPQQLRPEAGAARAVTFESPSASAHERALWSSAAHLTAALADSMAIVSHIDPLRMQPMRLQFQRTSAQPRSRTAPRWRGCVEPHTPHSADDLQSDGFLPETRALQVRTALDRTRASTC